MVCWALSLQDTIIPFFAASYCSALLIKGLETVSVFTKGRRLAGWPFSPPRRAAQIFSACPPPRRPWQPPAVLPSQGAGCNRLPRLPQARSGDPAGPESRLSCLPALSCLRGRTSVSLPCPCRGLASLNPSGGCPSPQPRATCRTQSRHTGEPRSRKGRPAGTGSASAEAGAPLGALRIDACAPLQGFWPWVSCEML